MSHQGMDNREKWIQVGYQLFGEVGPSAFNVERLSSILRLNRSSFYYYFGEVSHFEILLFDYHRERFKHMGKRLESLKQFDPERFLSSDDISMEIKFHRQLLIHETTSKYKKAFQAADEFTESQVFKLWAKHYELNPRSEEAFQLYRIIKDYCLLHYGHQEVKTINQAIKKLKFVH